jgi:transketolase
MNNYAEIAKQVRLRVLELCYTKKTSHIGGSLSVADILSVLYGGVLSISPSEPDAVNRDRLYYSKGHACAALYAVLEIAGFFPDENLLEKFTLNGSYFTSHINHKLPGIEFSTGSLGHALGVSCGSALACQRKGFNNTIFTILSDGELDEGSNWEAIMFAAHHHLDNIVIIIDYNKIQSFGSIQEVMNLEPLAEKFKCFNWHVREVNGHSTTELHNVLSEFKESRNRMPKCIIAHTIKGKGVSFMENELKWHYKSPSADDVKLAMIELESN